ncbi:MAG: hypothetical protein H7835_03110 [Magnetococcus sp. XQGC-1]
MKTGTLSHVRRYRLLWVGPIFGVLLAWPVSLLADPALVIGLLGGAVAGSLVGSDKWRGQGSAPVAGVATAPVAGVGEADAQRYRLSQPVTLTPSYASPNAQECRQVETQGFVNGQQEMLVGRACRTGQGGWEYVETPRIASRTVMYPQGAPLPDAVAVDPSLKGVVVYPVPRTLDTGPLPVLVQPPVVEVAPYGGRYYGHRDYWRERYQRRLEW